MKVSLCGLEKDIIRTIGAKIPNGDVVIVGFTKRKAFNCFYIHNIKLIEYSMEFKILNTKYPHKPTRIVNIAVYKTRPGTGNGATLKLVLSNNKGYREYSFLLDTNESCAELVITKSDRNQHKEHRIVGQKTKEEL